MEIVCQTGYIPEHSKPVKSVEREKAVRHGKGNNCVTLVERDPPKDRRGGAEILEGFYHKYKDRAAFWPK